jgi:hypothetical protein
MRPIADGLAEEILIPLLAPRQQITISYLYFPPILFNQINRPIYSDEGAARVITVLPQPQPPKWIAIGFLLFAIIGAVTAAYLLVDLGRRFW